MFSYQWLRNGVAIGSATASTYTLGDADVGAQISVQVSYTDGSGTAEGPLTSASVGPVSNVNDAPTGVPTISGTATEDQILTADTSAIGDADGLGAFSYQWLRNGANISGATSASYTLGDADVGTQISVRVSFTDGQGTAEGPLTSASVGPVANVNDAPTGMPTISGTATEDQIADRGHQRDQRRRRSGRIQLSVAAQRRAAISGATASTYTLGDADVGAQISVQVSYTDGQRHRRGPVDLGQRRTGGQRQRCANGRSDDQRHGDRGSDPDRGHQRDQRRRRSWAHSVISGCATAPASVAQRGQLHVGRRRCRHADQRRKSATPMAAAPPKAR